MPAKICIIGLTFGRLKVIAEAESRHGRRSLCLCVCGKIKTVRNAYLRVGRVVSCGCKRADTPHHLTHGHTRVGKRSRTYNSWFGMIDRCRNPNHHAYLDYGGRGITVCDRWRKFANFLADMGGCPPGLSIDRYPDNNGNYEHGNCRWATHKEQNRNQRANRVLTVHGVTACLAELCDHFSVRRSLVEARLHRGWPAERAFFETKHKTQNHVTSSVASEPISTTTPGLISI